MTVMKLGKKIRKLCVVSGVCDGFIGNRMINKYAAQAIAMLQDTRDEGNGVAVPVVSPDGEDDYYAPEYPDPKFKLVSLPSNDAAEGETS